jgi:putative tricarboxylic transport membrane protein
MLLALGVVALGIIVLVQTQDIRVPGAMARVGPRVIPTIVGGGLVLIGIWYAIEVLLGSRPEVAIESEDADPTLPADWLTIGGIGVALVVYMLTIERLGFIIASALLFVITAFSMGSRSWLRDIALGILIATAVYIAFSNGLGVRLPEGILEGLF